MRSARLAGGGRIFAGRDPDAGWKQAAGLVGVASVAVFVGGAFVALAVFAGRLPDVGSLVTDAYLRGVVLFTLQQAALSTLLSVAGAVPLALALHRSAFAGRDAVLGLLLLPQALPVLVGGLAILSLWGRGGIVSHGLLALGLPRLDIYGLPGILIAHVFFNLPLATRMMVAALGSVPAESWKLGGQLSLTPLAVFRIIEAPAIRSVLPGAASLIFMLCITSFTLVLVLGGGPGATTLEVAIYQSLRYSFDPGRATVLSLIQVLLTGVVIAASLKVAGTSTSSGFTLGRPAQRFDMPSPTVRALTHGMVGLGVLFVFSPFAAIVASGLRADLPRLLADATVQRAVATSIAIAALSASISVVLSLALCLGMQANRDRKGRFRANVLELSGSLVLVVPPIVLGTGWFLVLRQVTDVFSAAPFLVVAANSIMAMPFVLRIVQPALSSANAQKGRLAASLGLSGTARLRHVERPALAGPLGLAFAYALGLSLGDLGVAALFGNDRMITLPFLLMQRMGSYRSNDAAGLALILAILCLPLFAIAVRGFSMRRPTWW